MSQIHVSRIEQRILETYGHLIDMSDYSSKPKEEIERALRSRALAACSIFGTTNASPKDCADAITDGFNDNGIDAVYNDTDAKELLLVQSKWIFDGNGSPAQGDILKFLSGVKRAISLDFSGVSKKLQKKSPIIEIALLDSEYKIKLIIAHTGSQKLSPIVEKDVSDFINNLNDTSDVCESIILNQKALYDIVSIGAEASPITIDDVDLRDWGKYESPYTTYYGHISASVIAAWWTQYGNRLFAKNIRYYKGSSDTNEGMIKTLIDSPKDFWYFNNGIKVLCDSVKKKPLYGDDRSIGLFTIHGLSIANGAQTVGCIGAASRISPESIADASVMIQLISLGNTPDGYDTQVTKLSNTQNKIDGRDFAALDPQQDRIRRDLWMDGITYLFKDNIAPTNDKSITLDEATIALACYNSDVKFSTLAKRNIGAFYESVTKPPYLDIFNAATNAILLYNCALELRFIEKALEQKRRVATGKRKQILFHGNRFIFHCVLQYQTLHDTLALQHSMSDLQIAIEEHLDEIIDKIELNLQINFSENYINSLFKNNEKCSVLKKSIVL